MQFLKHQQQQYYYYQHYNKPFQSNKNIYKNKPTLVIYTAIIFDRVLTTGSFTVGKPTKTKKKNNKNKISNHIP